MIDETFSKPRDGFNAELHRGLITALRDNKRFTLPMPQNIREALTQFVEESPPSLLAQPAGRELLTCTLIGDYLPIRTFNTLCRELGITRVVTTPSDILPFGLVEQPKADIPKRHRLPGRIIFDSDLDADGLHMIARIIQERSSAIPFLAKPRYLAEDTGKPEHSILDLFVFSNDPVVDKQIKAQIIGELASINYLFLTKDRFYNLIPAGKFLAELDGNSFWVQELGLSNSLVYTDAAKPLAINLLLLHSNLTHEIGSHIMMSYAMPARFIGPDGIPIVTNSKLFYLFGFGKGQRIS